MQDPSSAKTPTPTPRRRHMPQPGPVEKASRPLVADKATVPSDLRAERLRRTLRRLAADRGLTINELGRRIGRRNGNAIYNFLNGRSRDLSNRTLIGVANVFGITLDSLTGHQPPEIPGLPPELIEVLRLLRAALDEVRRACDAVDAAIDEARIRP